jgi:hypothetical protein
MGFGLGQFFSSCLGSSRRKKWMVDPATYRYSRSYSNTVEADSAVMQPQDGDNSCLTCLDF